MKAAAIWAALRVALVRLRFVGLVAGAILLAAHLDDLEALVRRAARGAPAAAAERAGGEYVCPMHPDAVRSGPGACPACGMPLHRREADEGVHLALGAERARLGGLTFAKVVRRPLVRELTALATVELDERRVERLATPMRAQVLSVRVAAPGAPVRRGQVIATLGARELYQLGRDLQRELPPEDPTIVLARQRLLQMGLSEPQVDRLRMGHQPTAFDLLSPLDGILVAKTVLAGDQVAELTTLFTVADVSRLWLVVRLPEDQALLAGPGTPVEAELISAPGLVVRGRVTWQDAQVDPQTRTLAVRAEVDNPRGLLRPGMSGRARLRLPVGTPGAPPLVVPATAVVDTGLRQVVWREDEAGVVEPAEVKLAARVGAFVAVASGLEEGDRVVAQGAFLLSADQRLRPASGPAPAPAPTRMDRD